MCTNLHRANRARHCRSDPATRSWLFYMIELILVPFCNKCHNCIPSRVNDLAAWTEREAGKAIPRRSSEWDLSIHCRCKKKVDRRLKGFGISRSIGFSLLTSLECHRRCIELETSGGRASARFALGADTSCLTTARILPALKFSARNEKILKHKVFLQSRRLIKRSSLIPNHKLF